MTRRKSLTPAFGLVVRQARQDAGLTQERLAFKSQVHPTYISQLERGKKSPSLDVVAALARALKQRASVLIAAAETDDT